jgi:dTMP kinase
MVEKKEQEVSLKFKTNPYQGLFVCLEGIDACGKDTQGVRIAELLKRQNKDVILTEEPNKTFFMGEEIRAVLEHRYTENPIPSPLEFQEWYVYNRQHHLEELVVPLLEAEQIVLTLRSFWSTIAYGSLGVQKNTLIKLNQKFIVPDLTIFLDITPEEALKRKHLSGQELEFFEKLGKLKKVSQTYKWLALNYGEQITTVNGEQSKEKITKQIMNLIQKNQKFVNSKKIE